MATPKSQKSGASFLGIRCNGGERAPLLPHPPPPFRRACATVPYGVRRSEGAFSTSVEPFHDFLEHVAAVFAAAKLRSRHQSSLSTIFLNTSPRCSKLSNMSNEAQAGESRTMVPGVASERARSTASWSDGAKLTGTDASRSAAPIFAASSPMSTVWATWPRAARSEEHTSELQSLTN